MAWKLAQSDNHKWEPQKAMASLTTVRLNFNSEATKMLNLGGRYDLYTNSTLKKFKVVPNPKGRKLSDSSPKPTTKRGAMTYAHLGQELPSGRYFYIPGTNYEFEHESPPNNGKGVI